MAKSKEIFICQNCGVPSPKWQGQCAGCGEWNTLLAEMSPAGGARQSAVSARAARIDVSSSLAAQAGLESPRFTTGSTELDRVLGGGVVPGSVILIGGDPGIGKSTLMLQAAAALSAEGAVLYATGEESLQQVALRARRLGLQTAGARLIAETCVEDIVGAAAAMAARVLVVDSIQTMHSERVESAPGAVSQLRECTAELVRFAKASGTAVLLVGHVTKEGQIAGPRVLEHMVDTVLYFESDTGSRFRVLRSVKNRFGAANEIGVFAMVEQGLREVTNPFRDLSVAPSGAGVRQRHYRHAGGNSLAVDRGAGSPQTRVWAPIHAGWPSASTATGSPCCWRWRTATRDCSWAARMYSPMSSAACAWAKPPEIWPS